VVRRMYEVRFTETLDPRLTLQQIRGKEGIRVRESYARASRETGVVWEGRNYRRTEWEAADPINRALSSANSCLYRLCHAAIVSAGYSPALGFIHTGKQLSFVYDIADLYKADLTIPAAFQAVAESESLPKGVAGLEGRVRRACRTIFHQQRLLARIVADIDRVLAVTEGAVLPEGEDFDADMAAPGGWWDPQRGAVEGGVNAAERTPEGGER